MNTVLIVEDEKMIRQGIKTMVQRSGVPVNVIIECNNGLTALEILEQQKVDVMFTDIRMPKMNGIELVTAIQEWKDRPYIIAISGYDDFSYAVEMMRMGAREYILKPVDRDRIKGILVKLEKEIEQSTEKDRKARDIGYQQLKYLMLNHQITPNEEETIQLQCKDYFITDKYAVCCTQKKNNAFVQGEKYIHLSDVEKNEMLIVPEDNLNYLIRNELKNSYTGISSLHLGLTELKTAYAEAKEARYQAFIRGEHTVYYQDLARKSTSAAQNLIDNQPQTLDANKMIQMGQMVGTDKIKDVVQSLEWLKKEVEWRRYPLVDLEESIAIFIDTIKSNYQNVLEIEEEELEQFRSALNFACMEQYFQKLMELILHINEIINTQFDDYKNKHKIQLATEYIRENYNKDLNMAVVSNYISMNYSLFSYLFKQYTGSNFVNYLKDLRINEAKRLLKETDMYVNEISQQVGYNNEKHFMKIFRNSCGISPTEFRKNMMLNKSEK